MLLHYLGKVEIQISADIHSADMEESAYKLHFKCTDFNFSMRVTVHAELFMCFYQNLVLVAVHHVDC